MVVVVVQRREGDLGLSADKFLFVRVVGIDGAARKWRRADNGGCVCLGGGDGRMDEREQGGGDVDGREARKKSEDGRRCMRDEEQRMSGGVRGKRREEGDEGRKKGRRTRTEKNDGWMGTLG